MTFIVAWNFQKVSQGIAYFSFIDGFFVA